MKATPSSQSRAARAGAVGFTALALLLTAMTAWLLSRVFGEGKYANEPLDAVVVAAREIPAGQTLKDEDLKIVNWPKSALPKGSFAAIEQILGQSPGAGARVSAMTIMEGEPIISRRLASTEGGTGMASKVPKNLRAFPLQVESWIAEAKLVYPGAFVDVITTLKDPIDRTPVTKIVLQRVSVAAVGGRIDVIADKAEAGKEQTTRSKSVVTLLVTPEQSEVLALIAREGKVDLMLRNPADDESVTTTGTNPYVLLGLPMPEGRDARGQTQPTTQPKATVAQVPEARRQRPARRSEPDGDAETEPRDSGALKVIRLGGK